MKAVLQRVNHGSVSVEGKPITSIGRGVVTLLGIQKEDTEAQLEKMMTKIISLRIFPDEEGKMNLSLKDIQGEHLIVPQFTLLGNCQKGTRPSFDQAAPLHQAKEFFEKALEVSQSLGVRTQGGQFQSHMLVDLENDGPVTLEA